MKRFMAMSAAFVLVLALFTAQSQAKDFDRGNRHGNYGSASQFQGHSGQSDWGHRGGGSYGNQDRDRSGNGYRGNYGWGNPGYFRGGCGQQAGGFFFGIRF